MQQLKLDVKVSATFSKKNSTLATKAYFSFLGLSAPSSMSDIRASKLLPPAPSPIRQTLDLSTSITFTTH